MARGGSVVIPILIIFVMVAATILVAARHLTTRQAVGRTHYAADPDTPKPFGYRMAWLAIRSRDTAAVVEELGLVAGEPCNWNSGIGAIYDPRLGQNRIFVSPPVNGWTFVAGLALPHPAGRVVIDKATPLLVRLGGRFIEVQYYFAYPPLDLFAWARMIDGRLARAFAIGDDGIIWSKGKPMREEKTLGLRLFELRGVRGRRGDAGGEMILHPTEDHVMRLAKIWSVAPTELDEKSANPALGVIAFAPADWRVERVRKSA